MLNKKKQKVKSDAVEGGFVYHEQLEVAKVEIEKEYSTKDALVYRTMVFNPPTDYDITPQIFRTEKDSLIAGGLSKEEYGILPIKKKREYISERAISVNNSKEAAINSAKKTYLSLMNKFGKDYADEYIENERGVYVAPMMLKEEWAKISKFDKKGHANVILDQRVKVEDVVDVEKLERYEYEDDGTE